MVDKLKIKIKKLSPNAIIPTKKEGDAGYDLYSSQYCRVLPHETRVIMTDIAMAIPKGYYGKICERSGLAAKQCIGIGAGTIDETFRGNIGIVIRNFAVLGWVNAMFAKVMGITGMDSETGTFEIKPGMKIAQIVFRKYYEADFEEVQELDETDRAEKGWGSTGV